MRGLRVILAHADEPTSAFIDSSIRVEPMPFGGYWFWCQGGRILLCRPGDPVYALIGEVRVVDHRVGDDERATTVFVHAGADVVIARRDVGDRAVSAPLHEGIAPSFMRATLEPVHVVTVKRHKTEAHALFSDGAW